MLLAAASAVCCVLLFASVEGAVNPELTIIHFNDFHSRFDPVNPKTTGRCSEEIQDSCVGGFARMHAKITELKKADPSALVINAGDVFTGTLWFGLFRWNVTAEFMNMLPVDVQSLGNHEFDVTGVQAAVSYLKLIENTPTVISNIDASQEPDLEPFIQKSMVIEKNGLKIGVVGYVATEYPTMEMTGNLIFEDEARATNQAIKDLRDSRKVDVIIAVTHAGYEKDMLVAQTLEADIIVGAHSHTFLYTGTPPSPYDKPKGPYPTVVTQAGGRRVLVVQASAMSKYMGHLKVKFEKKGDTYQVASWEGNPILLDKTVVTDAAIEAKLQPWRYQVEKTGSQKVGESLVALDQSDWVCHYGECSIGRLVTDAMVYEYTRQREGRAWTRAAVAVMTSGGYRTSINRGNISYSDVLEAFPYEDDFGMVELNGQHFKELLEFSVENERSTFLQMSGVKAKFDLTKPAGERVSDIFVRCATCPVPTYESLLFHKYYRIIIPEYMYQGGDGYTLIKKRARFWAPGKRDTDVVIQYLKAFSPIVVELDENVSVRALPKQIERIITANQL